VTLGNGLILFWGQLGTAMTAGQVATIRDFRYVRYIAIDASIDATASDQGHP